MSVDMTKWCEIAKANMGKRPAGEGEFATSQRADVGIGPYRMRHEFAVSHRAEPRFYQLHWVPEYWLLSYSTRLNSP